MSCVIKRQFQDAEAFELLKKQFIGEFISSLNSPEYIANQYTKLYLKVLACLTC